MTQSKHIAYGIVAVLILGIAYLYGTQVQKVQASVSVTDEYMATSTAASTAYGATITTGRAIKTTGGTLGSFVITGANTGIINFYNATTTNVALRTGQVATSTILIASFPASTAAGTYTLDTTFDTGLYIDLVSGNMATGTVTYR